jgi:hypothetical protein
VLEEGIDGIAGLMGLYQFRAVAIVHAAFIAEAAATIKDKYMRSSLRTKRSRYRLGFAVVEVRICQMFVLCPDLHLLETVADVRGIEFIDDNRFGIVGLDCDHRYAAVLVVRGELRDTASYICEMGQ